MSTRIKNTPKKHCACFSKEQIRRIIKKMIEENKNKNLRIRRKKVKSKATKQRPSILKGEAKLELDEETKKVFGEFVKKAKKHKVDPKDFSQTIICGREEFAETEKHQKKFKK